MHHPATRPYFPHLCNVEQLARVAGCLILCTCVLTALMKDAAAQTHLTRISVDPRGDGLGHLVLVHLTSAPDSFRLVQPSPERVQLAIFSETLSMRSPVRQIRAPVRHIDISEVESGIGIDVSLDNDLFALARAYLDINGRDVLVALTRASRSEVVEAVQGARSLSWQAAATRGVLDRNPARAATPSPVKITPVNGGRRGLAERTVPAGADAHTGYAAKSVSHDRGRLRVFLDCPGVRCDFDFLRTEIGFVTYTHQREDADVHVLVTAENTGIEGRVYTLDLIGRNQCEGMNRTSTFSQRYTDTQDDLRRELARELAIGLFFYAVETPLGRHLHISYLPPETRDPAETVVRDPWNFWTFQAGANAYNSGEQSLGFLSLGGFLSANRTTDKWKLQASAKTNYDESRYDIDEDTRITSVQRQHQASSLVVRSLGRRWGAGAIGRFSSSTFRNEALSVRLAPAVEYNLFPYAESTRRLFTIRYSFGFNAFDYHEETLFGKTSETLPDQRLSILLDLRQPWGYASATLEGSQFLHDPGKTRLVSSANVHFRVFRGLGITFEGSVSLIRDQLSIPRRDATPEEILLRRRQLATSYWYSTSVGLTYTFGSIYNNVVNPRFR